MTNQQNPQSFDTLASGRSNSDPFITYFSDREPTVNDTNYPIQKRWFDTVLRMEWILVNFTSFNGLLQANWVPISETLTGVETLTGNSGGPVGVDGNNNINVVGDGTTINVVGTPGTNTLTISATGSIATTYTTDSGNAIPVADVLQVLGGHGNATTGAANVVTINAPTYTSDSGIATAALNTIHILGGAGITTSATGSTLTITNTFAGTSVIQVFTANGTYTPTTGMQYCFVEVIGGGGGGGGAAAASAGHSVAGAGGGAGEYARGVFSAATIGASQVVTIGSGGTGTAGVGNNGATTSLGALITAFGGSGAQPGSDTLPTNAAQGNGGTGGSGGSFRSKGNCGQAGFGIFVTSSLSMGGNGGASVLGGAGAGSTNLAVSLPGGNATGYGAGGGGAASPAGTAANNGGNGSSGIIIITEFL